MKIKKYDLILPPEKNGYCVFEASMEDDEYIFFHTTPSENKASILTDGFRSAQALGLGDLTSVSYAKNSSGCFAHVSCEFESDYLIFAVRFDSEMLSQVVDNPSGIHVYKEHLQPQILGFVYIPKGFSLQ